jgi:hypothetical protein
LAYFLADYYEKLYDDSLEALTVAAPLQATPSLLTTSPTILSTAHTSPIIGGSGNSTAAAAAPISTLASTKTSPPILLKISTRKLEIIASIKIKTNENELSSVLFLYLILASIEINDWINLKVMLPSVKYPKNNEIFFEKWFLYQFFNMLTEKTIIEQFKHDWFVSLIFDEFLFLLVQQKETQLATNPNVLNSFNMLYDQIYKLIDKLFPSFILANNFIRIIEAIKPKKQVNFLNLFSIFSKIINKLLLL